MDIDVIGIPDGTVFVGSPRLTRYPITGDPTTFGRGLWKKFKVGGGTFQGYPNEMKCLIRIDNFPIKWGVLGACTFVDVDEINEMMVYNYQEVDMHSRSVENDLG